jgi:hypothetical protein
MCLTRIINTGYKMFRRGKATKELKQRFDTRTADGYTRNNEIYEPDTWYTAKEYELYADDGVLYRSGFHICLEKKDLDQLEMTDYYKSVNEFDTERWIVEFDEIKYIGIDENTDKLCVVANKMKLVRQLAECEY